MKGNMACFSATNGTFWAESKQISYTYRDEGNF